MDRQRHEKLAWLQCARAFAAFFVAAFHASGRTADVFGAGSAWPEFAFQFGNAGVDLFFVISGFIIAHVHQADIGKPERLKGYAWKRITRIYPLYWILFIGVMPLYFVFPEAGDDFKRHWQNLLGSFLLLPTPPKQVISVAWSLVYEMVFYVIFGIAIATRRGGIIAGILWVSVIAITAAAQFSGGFYIDALTSTRFIGFFFGMAVAWMPEQLGAKRYGKELLFLCLSIFIGFPFAFGLGNDQDQIPERIGLYAAGALVIWAVVNLDRVAIKAPRLVVRLGDATYSIYLFHWLIGWVLAKFLARSGIDAAIPPTFYFGFMVAVMLAGGYILHRLLERPIMIVSRDIWQDASASDRRWPLMRAFGQQARKVGGRFAWVSVAPGTHIKPE